jgi:hypothetical protein
MSSIPPQMWSEPEDFPPAFRTDEEETEWEDESLSVEERGDHEHGPDCGHDVVEHGDHVDYVHGGDRHFLKGGLWHRHKKRDEVPDDVALAEEGARRQREAQAGGEPTAD